MKTSSIRVRKCLLLSFLKEQQLASVMKTLTKRKLAAAMLVGVAAFGISAGLSALRPPVPSVHDEFSYLLAADTFAKGRVTNPTHPHWQHFEAFHVIHQPSYSSKYPPGQGLFLALGQWFTGNPNVGIWILTGLAASATYWMLLGWTTARWAIVGAALFSIHPGFQIAWGQSYWGGTLAYLGGTLVFGAVARMRSCPRVRDALAMSSGAIVLAISRPFEGLVFCIIASTVVLTYWRRYGLPEWRVLTLRAVLPQLLVFLIGGAAMVYHNHAVTGSWSTLPYQVHEETYALSPNFLWKEPYADREYRHAVMNEFHHGWVMDSYDRQQSLTGLLETKMRFLETSWRHFFPLPLILPLLFVPFCRYRYKWTILAVAGIAWLPSVVTVWNYHHYLAPMAPVLLILIIMGLRQANLFGKQYLSMPRLATLFIACQVAFFGITVLNYTTAHDDGWQWQRAAIQQRLEGMEGQHLIMVRYESNHNTHQEWVYNLADIDAAKVIWAREMSFKQDQALHEYFADRHIWLLEADVMEPNLGPYKYEKLKHLFVDQAIISRDVEN